MPAPTMSLAWATSICTAMKAPDESPETELCLIFAPSLSSDSATDDRAGKEPCRGVQERQEHGEQGRSPRHGVERACVTQLGRRNFFRAICLMGQKPLASLERGCKYAIVSS